jgi:WD40 repeat protein
LPLLLCLLQGRTIEEAARQLGRSIGSLRGRLTRGRERLRQRLMRRGLDLSVGTVALLAPAVVPEKLLAESLRHLGGPVPAAISALAGGMMPALKLKIIGLVVVLVTAVGLGAGLSLRGTPEPETPTAPLPAPPPAQAKDEPRHDRYGDPLPHGAIARLGTVRFRVDAWIEGLAFAPDGKSIAVRGNTGIWLLDTASGKQIRRIDSSGSDQNPQVAFSPDGKRLISPCRFGEKDPVRPVVHIRRVVRVWETVSGRKLMESEMDNARWVGWSEDGQPLAAYLAKGEIRLGNLATGRERHFPAKELPDPIAAEMCLCDVAKNVLAASDQNIHIHVWDLTSGKERCLLKTSGQYSRSLALSPDGRWLASLNQDAGGKYAVRLWDTATGEAVHRISTDQKHLRRVFFSPDGKKLATVGWSEVHFWNAAVGSRCGRIKGGGGYFGGTCLSSPDGKILATTEAYSGVIHLWGVPNGTKKPSPQGHTNRPDRPSFSLDGKRVATVSEMEGTFFIWDPSTGEPLLRMHREDGPSNGFLSADGRTLYLCGGDKLYFIDAATGKELHSLRIEDPDHPKARQSGLELFLADDRERLIVLSSGGNREKLVTGWEVATRKRLFCRRRVVTSQWRSAVSPDARMLAAADAGAGGGKGDLLGGGPMYLEDLATGERLLTFPSFEGQRWPLVLSPDGRLMISYNNSHTPGKQGSTLRLWEVLTGSELQTLPATDGNDKAAFSPDSRLLAVTAPEREIITWDLRRGKELRRLKGFGAQVTSLAFSPYGRRLVSGLSDSTLLVWDVGAFSAVRVQKLGADGLAKAWADLADKDAPRAFRARGILASAPEEAIPLLTKHLHPARSADPQRLRQFLTDLESDQFTVREKAQGELAKLGDLAEPALRRTLENKPTLEVRRRVQVLLERLRGPVTRPEMLQALRSAAVLEDIGTPEARRLLQELAKGAPEARLTREAKASLGRLDLRKPFPSRDR